MIPLRKPRRRAPRVVKSRRWHRNRRASGSSLCFDGTANQIGAGNLTNVAKLFEMLDKNHPAAARLLRPRCGDPGARAIFADRQAGPAVRAGVRHRPQTQCGTGLPVCDAALAARRRDLHLRFQPRRLHRAGLGRHAAAARVDATRIGEPAALRGRKVRSQPVFHPGRVRQLGAVRPGVLLAHRERATLRHRETEQPESGVALRHTGCLPRCVGHREGRGLPAFRQPALALHPRAAQRGPDPARGLDRRTTPPLP